jgi:transposase InsO family protein
MSVYQFLTVGVKVDYDLDPERGVTLFTKKDRKIVEIGPIRGKSFYMIADSPASYHVNRLEMHRPGPGPGEDRAWTANDIMLWHNRLGHLSLRAIKKLQSSEGVTGMTVRPSSTDECICEACMLGKLCKTPHKAKGEQKRKAAVGDLIHADLVGPFQTALHSGKRYFLLFTDDHSRWTSICFMRSKDEVPVCFKGYEAMLERQCGAKVKRLRVDAGGEFSAAEFLAYFAKEGITKEMTTPHLPASNGTAERANRGVLDPMRTMLKHAGLPDAFWAEASATAVYINNRLLHSALDQGTKSPYMVMYKETPDIGHLRIFGCIAYAHIPKENRKSKLDDRARKCILLGYNAETTTQWRLWDLDARRILISRDIKFDEGRVWIPVKRTVSSVSRGPSVSLIFGVFGTDDELRF